VPQLISDPNDVSRNHNLVFKDVSISSLNEVLIARYASAPVFNADIRDITVLELEVDKGIFTNKRSVLAFPDVVISQQEDQIILSCDCQSETGRLCEHQALVLNAIIKRDDFRTFFDRELRSSKIRKMAADYGLDKETDLDAHFSVEYKNRQLFIQPRNNSLLAVTKESIEHLRATLIPAAEKIEDTQHVIVLIRQHRYYKYLNIELYTTGLTLDGKPKNPLRLISPLEFVWETEDHEQLKFFTGVQKFQNRLDSKMTEADVIALKAIVKNPLGYEFYFLDGDNVTAATVRPVSVNDLHADITLQVAQVGDFYELTLLHKLPFNNWQPRFTYFLSSEDQLYLPPNLPTLQLIALFAGKQSISVHVSKYNEFKAQLLNLLEDRLAINYRYIPLASPQQRQKQGFNEPAERIIYLSDFGAHVMLIPVMRYGEVEIAIRSKRQIYTEDSKGKAFLVERDKEGELAFTALLLKQHAYFEEQLENDLHYFYLHKKRFLQEDWFLQVFEDWQQQHITILGFNELEGNKLNPHKVKITINVLSGINWFNALVDVRFGRKRAALKQIYRAVKNKTKYVQLDGGTHGIIPADWLSKFEKYFNAGEIAGEGSLHIPKINYNTINELFDVQQLDEQVKTELNVYEKSLSGPIPEAAIPEDLCGELRPYQHEGLNWLNRLDDLNFGGCLADDMGLGKSIQIIAFILLLRKKVHQNTNLLVVPTSLIFNWEQEIEKFAPSIRVLTIYGNERNRSITDFDHYEVILTSYGTLLADIGFLKDYAFNYVFLDESQQIKNPESQRYKAVRLLQARNRIVITFYLYGQLSFACPGLLGSKQYFKAVYSSPIDKFKSSKRAAELQQKVAPFILRRTKQQVAAELPEKTEMILYCRMGEEQRKIYDVYETEFRDYISALDGDVLKKSSMHVLKGLTQLRQICNSPLLIKGDKLPGQASAKLETLLLQLEEKSPQHKILVFSQFVGMLDLIQKELVSRSIGFSRLTGQTRNREQVVEGFQTQADKRVFLISLKAGGTGLNLTEADYVYLIDPWWNPAVENQAIDRSHRIGQNKPVIAIRLISPSTVEEKIQLLQDDKKIVAGQLIPTEASQLSSFSKTDLLSLLS
jgi:superfamily II DNA or RNA helicase